MNFPIALARHPEMQYAPNEIVYEYQYLRLSPTILGSKYVIETYNFRVNQTSSFYFTLGMHMLRSQLVLKLRDVRGDGSVTHIGKQEFSLNILHLYVGPGDYSLDIEQPSVLTENQSPCHDDCGIYSFFGRITPISESQLLGTQSLAFGQGGSQCEIKEVLPSKIFSSEDKAKDGHEYFVNKDGSFSRIFEDVLVKPQEFDTVMISSPTDGLLTVLI